MATAKPISDPHWWQYRESRTLSRRYRMLMAAVVFAGVLSILNFGEWWFREEHVVIWPLYIILSFIFWWGILRMILIWITYLNIRKPETPKPEQGMRVAIFTTSSPGEPLSMFEKTLEACANINYPHTTYLLDDTQDPAFRAVAQKHGAVWLELVGLPGAKAGKINAALDKTTEDFILVLDPDHIPFPNFLDKVLGFFRDPKVGFVQVSQAYYNQSLSFTAHGAAEQTYSFYGPTQMGLHGYGCAVAIGANCTFRREALQSIGGHGIGLAEDLVTSIRLHGKGWKSVYNPVVVSRGLVPEDLGSFAKQQLKWARGVHEVLFAELPKAWKGLSFWQRLSYLGITTYYLNGLSMFFFVLIPYFYFWLGILPANMDFLEFLVHWLPLGFLALILYLMAQRTLSDPITERGIHWRGMMLKFATWPVFMLGFLLSLVNAKIPYIPTSKQANKGWTPFYRPILIQQLVFVATLTYIFVQRSMYTHEAGMFMSSLNIWGMISFASLAFFVSLGGFYAAWQSRNQETVEAWSAVDLDKLKRFFQKNESILNE